MATPISIRQQILDAIAERFSGILVSDGYQTDIGAKVTKWEQTPVTELRDQGVDISDPKEDLFPGTTLHQDHDLFIHLKVFAKLGRNTADYLRNAIADIYRTVGVDRAWGGLARSTEPVTDQIEVDQNGKITGAAYVLLKVKYRTATFNPFSQ